jgi:hypothetical protein
MLLPQVVEPVHECRLATLRRRRISQIDEKIDGAIVAGRLFCRVETVDFIPYCRLFLCDHREVLRARQRGLTLPSRRFDPGSFCFRAPPLIASVLRGLEAGRQLTSDSTDGAAAPCP